MELRESLIFQYGVNGESVSVKPEPGNESVAATREAGFFTVLFAGEQIGYVDFHHRSGDGFDGIGQYDGSVSVGAGVEDDSVVLFAVQNPLHQFFQPVGLEKVDLTVGKLFAELLQIIIKGGVPVDIHFP